ncbi:MAG: hypothetical protein GY756_28315 [bacterium]|nr:hypothetical protein [bacterium]
MTKHLLLLFILLITMSPSCWSQKTITGKVTDNDKNVLPGATIQEKGTDNTTKTDSDGNYSITINDTTSTLSFYYIGMISREIQITGQLEINTTLKAYTIYEAWDQKLRFFINSGLIENPVGGQFEFAIPTFINAISLHGNCSYQTNLKENNYFDVGLRLNGIRLFNSYKFYLGVRIESNYRHILFNSSGIETISFESLWWSSLPFDLIVGYCKTEYNQNSQTNTNSGVILGTEVWIPKPLEVTVKGKVSFLKDLPEYQAEVRKRFGKHRRIHSFVKYYNNKLYSELSFGLGIELTYYFRYQKKSNKYATQKKLDNAN